MKTLLQPTIGIGFACLTVGVPGLKYRTLTQKSATREKLFEVIKHNLDVLEKTVVYAGQNGLSLLRITSDLIPLATLPKYEVPWLSVFADDFERIAQKIAAHHIRISFHPGQYTVLNSPDEKVVAAAIADLIYHADLLEALGGTQTNKIVLHIGGAYGNKKEAMHRFATNFGRLPIKVRRHLVIENDERTFTAQETLDLAQTLSIPMVYDNLHDALNPSSDPLDSPTWIDRIAATWQKADGRQKTHYSQADLSKHSGAHSQTIAAAPFLSYVNALHGADIDIMLEVKDKNISAIKANNLLRSDQTISHLEKEWALYKYAVLERAPMIYQRIRSLLKDKDAYPAQMFYLLIEEAMAKAPTLTHTENAADHVWGYFKNLATPNERRHYEKLRGTFHDTGMGLTTLKKDLLRLAEKYHTGYLIDSYYFNEVRR